MKKKNRSRVIVIGIDGAGFNLINKLIDEDRLPNIKKLIESRAYGDLQSTIQPSSEQAWSSFMTGMNNGKHGIYGFIQRKPSTYDLRIVNGRMHHGKTLWSILSDASKKVIVINVPMTYPPEKVNGVLISSFFAPSTKSDYTYPPYIKEEIKENIGKYILEVTAPIESPKENPDATREFVNKLRVQLEQSCKVIDYFMENYDWDFFMYVFTSTERASHKFWSSMEGGDDEFNGVIPELYESIDKRIGDIVSKMQDDDILIIMSDHGLGPLKKVVLTSRWLEKEGYLVRKKSARVKKFINNGRILSTLYLKLITLFRSVFRIGFPQLMSKMVSAVGYFDIDWSRTKAYMVGGGNICINLKGREPAGIVKEEEYEKVRNNIIKRLSKFKDGETGEIIMRKVYKREEIYHGKYLNEAPDIIPLLNDGYRAVAFESQAKSKDILISSKDEPLVAKSTGCHYLKGIVIMYGKDIKKGRIDNANIIDVMPTILSFYGLSIPDNVDGKVFNVVKN